MRRLSLLSSISSPFIAVALLASLEGCSSSSKAAADAAVDSGDSAVIPTDNLLELPCTDSMTDVYGPPGALTAAKGTILKCAFDQYLTASAFEAQAKTNGYVGPDFTSGAFVYRVLYVTQRGDAANSPGFSTAIVYLPDTPIASSLPLITASHGTVGQGKTCLVSQDQALAASDPDGQLDPFPGAGYPIIMSDYAGYAQYGASGNPPSGYLVAGDPAKSVLDAVHALRTMIPSHASQKVIITGHSQGGHVALSALSMAETYGVDGTLAGVVAYSPVWFSNLTYGGAMLLGGSAPYTLSTSDFDAAVIAWYFYSRSELTDGPGHGIDVFAPSAQTAIKSFFDNTCLEGAGVSVLQSLGTYIDDLFNTDFINGVGAPAGLGEACGTSGTTAALAFCNTWLPRMKADRPHITGSAKTVPILWMYGAEDTTIAPDYSTCGVDRLNADGAALRTCIVPLATHAGLTSVTRIGAPYVLKWVSAQGLGTADPGACPLTFTIATDGTSSFQPENDAGVPDPDAGAPVTCTTLPPNSADD